jgi:hypothetical protein
MRKIDNFLPSQLGLGIVFQKDSPARTSRAGRVLSALAREQDSSKLRNS